MKAMITSVGWQRTADQADWRLDIVVEISDGWQAEIFDHPENGWEVIYFAYDEGEEIRILYGSDARRAFTKLLGEIDFFPALDPIATDLREMGREKAYGKWRGQEIELVEA